MTGKHGASQKLRYSPETCTGNDVYNWHDEPAHAVVYLEKKVLSKLTHQTLSLYGGANESLASKIRRMRSHVGISKISIKKWLYGYTIGGIEVKNLKLLCKLLQTPLNRLNTKILLMGQRGKNGRRWSIENPRLPWTLKNESGGVIIGAQAGDATLSKKAWSYYNTDATMLKHVDSAVKRIFGRVRKVRLYNRKKRLDGYQYPPQVARAINVLTGLLFESKSELNPGMSHLILNATPQILLSYFRQRLGDEGTCDYYYSMERRRFRGKVCYYQSVDLSKVLRKIGLFDVTIKLMRNTGRTVITPSGSKHIRSSFGKIANPAIRKVVLENFPKWLKVDNFLLAKVLKIQSSIRPHSLYLKVGTNKISCLWISQIRQIESLRRTCNLIGFPQQNKQSKLEKIVKLFINIKGGERI